jgi:serine/threonine protein kinase
MRNEERSAPVVEGEILAGKYRVERVLGAGGMGVVVAARHLQLDQLVALKFVLPSALEESTTGERFLREARAAVRLKSEHVAKVLDVGTLENGAPYMVMEYLEGTDLGEVIHRQAPMPFDVACDYLIQACEALSEAHSLGIVHRDLKPQNLFLTKGVGGAPLVKVLDFGISKIKQPEGAQNLTQTATVMGSPLYMAPEQMRSARNVDNRTDIWALGCVLHEMLTRKLPFEAETMTELAIKIVQDPVVPVEQLRPDIPPELAAVVHRCLEKDVTRRFPDTGELAEALEPFAPAASRVIVDRARKVISGLQKTLGAAAAGAASGGADGTGPVRAVSSPTHPGPGTPKPWSETKGEAPKSNVVLVGVVSAAVAVVVAFFLFRLTAQTAPAEPPSAGARAEPASLSPSPVPAPVPAAAAPASSARATPDPPPTPSAPAASAVPSQVAPQVAQQLAPALTPPPRVAPPPPRGPLPTAKPPAPGSPKRDTNDDIPSLR